MSVVHRVVFETESIHSIEFVKVSKMTFKMFAAEGDNIAALTTLELMVQRLRAFGDVDQGYRCETTGAPTAKIDTLRH